MDYTKYNFSEPVVYSGPQGRKVRIQELKEVIGGLHAINREGRIDEIIEDKEFEPILVEKTKEWIEYKYLTSVPQGVQGFSGTQGIQGCAGTSGVQGSAAHGSAQVTTKISLSGVYGSVGTQGFQGFSGSQGYSTILKVKTC